MNKNARRQSDQVARPTPRRAAERLWQRLARAALATIRVFMVYTGNTPILATLYRVCANVVLRRVVAVLRRHPAIVSIYLRRSSSSGEQVVGLSDFDLGVVMESPKGCELETKQSVYRHYRRAVRRLPRGAFDTNLSIYTAEEIRTLLFDPDVRGLIDAHLTYRLLEGTTSWTLLHGTRALPCEPPRYARAVRGIMLLRELQIKAVEMLTVYRSFAGFEYPIPGNRLARISMGYTIYKRVADYVRTSVLLLHPEMPLTFHRANSIKLGLEHLADLLSDADMAFLHRAEEAGDDVSRKNHDVEALYLEYKRFALRFPPLVESRLASKQPAAEAAEPALANNHLAALHTWYPEFCPKRGGARRGHVQTPPEPSTHAREVLAWFQRHTSIPDEDVAVTPWNLPWLSVPPHNEHWLAARLKTDPNCPTDELRFRLGMGSRFDAYCREHIPGHVLVEFVLCPQRGSRSGVRETDMITTFCSKDPAPSFTTLHPSLFLTESVPLSFRYVMFWSLMTRYTKLSLLLDDSVASGSPVREPMGASEIAGLLRDDLLPAHLWDKFQTVYGKYHEYVDGTPSAPPTYHDFVSCALSFEEYLNGRRQGAGSGPDVATV